MMLDTLDYLYENEGINIYIIRALLNSTQDFNYKVGYDEGYHVIGTVALWEKEKIATLRGDIRFCKAWFDKLYGKYHFYDLEYSLAECLLREKNIESEYIISKYLLLEYTPNTIIPPEKKMRYKVLRKNTWENVEKFYKEKYGIYFTPFNENTMTWLAVNRKDIPISTMCLEHVEEEGYVISNFYTVPERRGEGIGTRFLQMVLTDFGKKKCSIFVEENNETALAIYKKLGFCDKSKLVNFDKK